MELENHGNSGYNGNNCKMRESHFEARLIADELMISTAVSFTQRISPMTLAVFEDSGWYQVDYSKAGLVNDAPFVNIDTTKPGYLPFVEGIDSGFKKGCGYARDDKCIDSNQQPTDERWCTDVPKRQSDGSDVWSTMTLADRDITIQQGPGWECHPNRMELNFEDAWEYSLYLFFCFYQLVPTFMKNSAIEMARSSPVYGPARQSIR